MKFILLPEERELFEEGIIKPCKFVFSSWKNFFTALFLTIAFISMYFGMIITAEILGIIS